MTQDSSTLRSKFRPGVSVIFPALIGLGLAALAAACNHDKPFQPNSAAVDTTRTRGTDRQLTYNIGADVRPAWLSNGSGLLFAYEDLSRDSQPQLAHQDTDLCLSQLPATGGTITREICGTTFGSHDSIDTFYEAAEYSDGRLLYDRESSIATSIPPVEAALVLSTMADPSKYTTVRTYPYPAPNGKIHFGISDVHWLSSTSAIYLAQQVFYLLSCSGCPIDTVRSGIELVKVDLSSPTPTLSIVPNSQDASSVTVSQPDGGVYFTRNGDSRVFSLDIVTGAVTIVHDFGLLGIARDVEVVGNRMIAVVGGRINYGVDPTVGLLQRDVAGQLWEVDIATGNAAALPVNGRLFRRPALSPAGNQVAAEAFFILTAPCLPAGCIDTLIAKTSDIWLVDLP